MKILFANQRMIPPFGVGGDTVSLNIILKYLVNNNYKCISLGSKSNPKYIKFNENIFQKLQFLNISYTSKKYGINKIYLNLFSFPPKLKFYSKIEYYYPNKSILIEPEFFIAECENLIKQFNPDIIFTQMEGALEVINLANKYQIPVIYFVYDVEELAIGTLKSIGKTSYVFVVFLSEYAQKYLKHYTKCRSKVIYQPLENQIINNDPWSNEYVTMINPVKEKGGEIIYQIISSSPETKFQLVEGWTTFANIPYPFAKLPNVKLDKRQNNLKEVYDRTRILLMPSIWNEGFGRVIIEAGIYGIPTIASNRGGIKEAVGNGGIIINNYQDINEWIKNLNKLRDKRMYSLLSSNARKHAKKFSLNIQCKQLENIIKLMT